MVSIRTVKREATMTQATQCNCRANYSGEVQADVVKASIWSPEYAMYQAPGGRFWCYVSVLGGMEVQCAHGVALTWTRWETNPATLTQRRYAYAAKDSEAGS